MMDLKQHVRQIADFPRPGINFFDISTLIRDPAVWRSTIDRMGALVAPWRPQMLAALDARGFLVASPVALALGCGIIMVRKSGKLPGGVKTFAYGLEYGNDAVQIQDDAVSAGQRIVIIDDLLATGGTIKAAAKLIGDAGATVAGAACIIELSFLKARQSLGCPFASLIQYDTE